MTDIIRADFHTIVGRITHIPSLPEVVTQVVRLVNDPRTHAEQVHQIMAKDAAMASKILRVVNSPYYGLSHPVHDLDQAIMVLGFKTIRSIALSISVINLFQQQDANFNLKNFWTHSAVMACIGRLMGIKTKLPDPEVGFVLGLIKDIGMLLLVQHAPEELRNIIAVAREFRLGFQAATRKVINTDHAEIGAWLCEKWGMEKEIVDAVRFQNDADKAPNKRVVSILIFGEYLCSLKKIRTPGQCDEPKLDPNVWHHLGIDKTGLVDVLSVINDEVENARQLLKLAS